MPASCGFGRRRSSCAPVPGNAAYHRALRVRGTPDLNLGHLQMLRVAAPTGRRYRPALATGLTLLRHPAFAAQPGAASCTRGSSSSTLSWSNAESRSL